MYILCPSLRISGQWPAPIVNDGGDSFKKQTDFQLSRAHDLNLRLSHTAYHRASLIDVYLHAKFHWNQINFFVDGRTSGQKSRANKVNCLQSSMICTQFKLGMLSQCRYYFNIFNLFVKSMVFIFVGLVLHHFITTATLLALRLLGGGCILCVFQPLQIWFSTLVQFLFPGKSEVSIPKCCYAPSDILN